jgi:GH25 family lysozyme M1 (1,4-beta-N-acetylmuramidase)
MNARLPRVTCLLAMVASVLVVSSTTADAATRLPGIDVSEYQGAIDWSTVATTPTRFVIIRATKGRSYDDPKFATNLAGARSNGLEVGAYHRATPQAHKNGTANLDDARAEADHFLDTADPDAGDIIPALDIEETGGMPPAELVAWVKTWTIRVTNRLGVHPMLYASPNFWRVNMGDSRWFADHGYRLWLAHWNVTKPDVPANDWQGAGWTFWQWTHEPGLPGITGDLDRDRFDSAHLVTAEISRLTVHTGAGGSVSDSTGRLACADGASCDALYDPSAMVTLTATPDPGAVFLSWTGACAAAGSSPTCVATVLGMKNTTATFGYPLTTTIAGPGAGTVTSAPTGIACPTRCFHAFPAGSSISLTAAHDGASEFDSWSGACAGLDPSSCSITMNRPRNVTAAFADLGPPSAVITTPSSLTGPVRIAFSEPVHAVDAKDLFLRVAGETKVPAILRCWNGEGARVSCHDGPVLTAALRASPWLVAGQSYVAIANPNGVSSTIVDRAANPLPTTAEPFRAATDVNEAGPGSTFGWGTRDDARTLGGSYLFERRAGATVTFSFTGSRVTLWTVAGPAMGRTRIEIDGSFRTHLDGARPAFAVVGRTFTDLGHGTHSLAAITLPSTPGHPSGTGIDAITDANGTRRSPKTTSAGWAPAEAPAATGGRYVLSGIAGAQTTFRFRGTAVSLRSVTGPGSGRAQIWVDGTLVRHLDLSATTTTYGVMRTVSDLEDRVHTVRILVVGKPGTNGSGTAVALDGWVVT